MGLAGPTWADIVSRVHVVADASKNPLVAGPCWIWEGSLTTKGYGGITKYYGGGRKNPIRKSFVVHRVMYNLVHGDLSPQSDVHHRCEVKSCCNPEHLQQVTRAEHNVMTDPGRKHREKTHCPSGHPYSGRNLYVAPRGDRQCRTCRNTTVKLYRERNR